MLDAMRGAQKPYVAVPDKLREVRDDGDSTATPAHHIGSS
jgi:hypothetical protein